MRSFNANFVTEKNRRADGPAPVNLLTANFSTPVYLADRDMTPTGGSVHAGLIVRWGFIDSALTQTPGSGVLGSIDVADLEIEIINMGSSPFSDNFTVANPPENVLFELYQWFDGLLYSEKEPIFKGYPVGQIVYDRTTCRIRLESVFCRYNRKIGEDLIINADDYPGADPDDIGKMMSIGYGTVRRSPCRAVDAGGKTTIVSDWTDTSPGNGGTVDITDGTYLPTTAFVFQVDSEQISIASRSGNTLTLAASGARGYSATTAVDHDAGSACAEIKTAYVYDAAGHPVKSIDAVYVDRVRQTTGYTAYTGQAGAELSGYEGLAVVKFTVLPTFKKQVDVAVDSSGLSVDSSDLGVADSGHTHDGTEEIVTWNFELATKVTGLVYNPKQICDGSFETQAGFDYKDSQVKAEKAYYESHGGAPTHVRLCMRTGTVGTSVTMQLIFCGTYINMTSSNTTGKGSWVSLGSSYNTWAEINAAAGYVNQLNSGNSSYVEEIWAEFKYTPDVDSGTANVSLSGDADLTGSVTLSGNTSAETVIGRSITVDMAMYADDASGTYTGTANALIERPNHVFKHIWTELCGGTAGDFDIPIVTAVFFATNSYVFSVLINQVVQAETLLMRLALQCRSRFFVSPYGTARMVVRQLGQTSGHSIAASEIKEGSVSISRMATTDLINYFNIYFDKDHSQTGNYADNYAGAKLLSDATSISRYGKRTFSGQSNLFCFDAVTDATMAAHVGAFLLDFHKIARRIPCFAVFLDNMEIEPADIIDITHSLDSMSAFTVEVQKILHRIGSARQNIIDHIEIVAIEN